MPVNKNLKSNGLVCSDVARLVKEWGRGEIKYFYCYVQSDFIEIASIMRAEKPVSKKLFYLDYHCLKSTRRDRFSKNYGLTFTQDQVEFKGDVLDESSLIIFLETWEEIELGQYSIALKSLRKAISDRLIVGRGDRWQYKQVQQGNLFDQ